ncbi:MAG TPA: peptidase M22 [Lacunisphaera sp.]|nr:peptidase M22 [Lacunisphaera sp.]
MACLSQIIANHGSILVLDAASQLVQVGLRRAGQASVWRRSTTEAGTGLFAETQTVLAEARVALDEVGAFVFCEGPGSMLGTRIVAMAIRTWQLLRPRPTYAYQSLPLLAHNILHRGVAGPFAVVTDARRDSWNCVRVSGNGAVQPLRRCPSTELAASNEPLYSPPAFRAWTTPPRPLRECPYDVATLLEAHADLDLFHAASTPDAFQHEAPEYKKWSAQAHSAETAPPR